MKQPDHTLVEKALKGDRHAFRQIVEQSQDMVYRVARRFLPEPDEAEDAVQEVYVRLWKNLKNYRTDVKLTTWLYRIVTNYCLDIVKSSHYQASIRSVAAEDADIRDNTGADRQLDRMQLHELVRQAAARLTPVQQSVFILRDLEGMSVDEVSIILDMGADAIKSNLYHARKRMAVLLKPFQHELL